MNQKALCLITLFISACVLQSCPGASYFNTSLCFDIRHKNAPNCHIGQYPQVNTPIEADTTVAFIGDVSVRESSSGRVLQLISDRNADLVLHAGDFDYRDSPLSWETQLNETLGADFPYYASMGNHEYDALEGTNGYQQHWFDKLVAQGANCIGTVGLAQVCSWRGITFFLATQWLEGIWEPDFVSHEELITAIEDSFTQFGGRWRVCVWHFNDYSYQLGDKGSEAPAIFYDACRRMGAIISTGHEHSYARTHLMADFENHVVANQESSLLISEGDNGRSVAWVSGVGGLSIRPCLNNAQNNPWWASAICSDSAPPLQYGVLFCNFNPGGQDQNLANCWFEQIDGEIRDEFTLRTTVTPSTCCQPDPEASCRRIRSFDEPAACGVTVDTGCGIIDCTCSQGEICQDQVCQCNPTECSALGRVCSRLGCVFADNPNATGVRQDEGSASSVVVPVVVSVCVVVFCICLCVAGWSAFGFWKKKQGASSERFSFVDLPAENEE